MITWVIDELVHTVNSDGSAGFVTFINWTAHETVDALTTSRYGAEAVDSNSTLGTTPYDAVTESDCTVYLEANMDMVALQGYLDAQIAVQGQPQRSSGLPWVDNYPQWVVPLAYVLDDVVQYKGTTYKVVQAHTSQATWPPDITPALWAVYVPAGADPQPWVQPTGAQDAYAIGVQVTHDNPNDSSNIWIYTSAIDANTTEPGRDGAFDRWWTPISAV